MTNDHHLSQQVKIHIDDIYIEGTLELPNFPVGIVVFAHGSGSSRFSPRNGYVAAQLRLNGIGTLLLDLLTHEEDQDFSTRFDIDLLANRLTGAVNWLRSTSITATYPIGIFGASTGAAAALRVAAFYKGGSRDAISAVVSRGGRPDMAGERALKRVSAPTLFIVGGNDPIVIELNEQAYFFMECLKLLEIIPGATHLFEEPGALEQVSELAVKWFLKYLNSRLSNVSPI